MAIATLTIDMVAKLANLERDMGKAAHIAERNAAKMDAAFAKVSSSLAAIGATLSVGAFVGMVRSVADAGDELQKLSIKTGIAVEDLSKLQYAASLSDLSNEDLSAGLIKLNRVMGDAADGSKEATAALARFGIAPDAGLSAIDAFKKIADRVKATGDEAKIASGLNDVFGRSFEAMIPALKGGGDGLKKAGDELERLGGVMSGDLAASSEAFNDNITRLYTKLNALKLEAVGPLIPLFLEISDAMAQTSEKSGELSMTGQVLKTVFETVAVLGANVAYVFRSVGTEIGGIAAQVVALSTGDFKAFSNIGAAMREDAEKARKEVDALSERLMNPARLDAPAAATGSDLGIRNSEPKSVKEKAQAYTDLLTPAAEAYAKTIEKINAAELSAEKSTRTLNGAQESLFELMSSADWQKMPEAWQQVAIAQAAASSIAIEAADSQKKLNDLLAATPTAQIELAQEDMLLLADALERGAISAEQFQEAATKRLDLGTEAISKQKSMAEELGLTFTSAFEDAVAGGKSFSDVLKGIEQDIIKLMVRKSITEPLLEGVKGFDFGSIFSGLFANAKGGVYSSSSLSAYSNSVVSKPTIFPFAKGAGLMGEAGPEAILPLSRDASGRLGVSGAGSSVVVNVINNADGTKATQETRQDAGGKTIIDVMIETVKAAIAGDIASGGTVAGAMENQYALNRSAGAWR